jgi:hypothetical protein
MFSIYSLFLLSILVHGFWKRNTKNYIFIPQISYNADMTVSIKSLINHYIYIFYINVVK